MGNEAPAIHLPPLTVSYIRSVIGNLYRNDPTPSAAVVQALLDRIEAIPDDRTRSVLYATARQHVRGGGMKDLIMESRNRAKRKHGLIDVPYTQPIE